MKYTNIEMSMLRCCNIPALLDRASVNSFADLQPCCVQPYTTSSLTTKPSPHNCLPVAKNLQKALASLQMAADNLQVALGPTGGWCYTSLGKAALKPVLHIGMEATDCLGHTALPAESTQLQLKPVIRLPLLSSCLAEISSDATAYLGPSVHGFLRHLNRLWNLIAIHDDLCRTR